MIYRTKNHQEQKPQRKNLKRKIKVISNKSMIAAKIWGKKCNQIRFLIVKTVEIA